MWKVTETGYTGPAGTTREASLLTSGVFSDSPEEIGPVEAPIHKDDVIFGRNPRAASPSDFHLPSWRFIKPILPCARSKADGSQSVGREGH